MWQAQINPADIDIHDRRYSFTHNNVSDVLKNSIKTIGIIHPIILEKLHDHRYRIVSGSRRVHVAMSLGLKEIPARIFSQNEKSPFQLFLLNLYENLTVRLLNPIENARILYKLMAEFEMPKFTILETYLPLLQLGKNPKVLETYLKFNDLEDYIQQAVVDDFIGIEMAIKMLDFSQEDRLTFFMLAKRLQLGKNRQRELLNLLLDLSKRDDLSFSQIIDTESIQEILSNDSIATPIKAERVRHILHTRRYPRFSEVEREFNDIVKRMRLPRSMSLTPFAYFEQSRYTLKFEFADQKDFEHKLDFLQKLIESGYFKQLDKLC